MRAATATRKVSPGCPSNLNPVTTMKRRILALAVLSVLGWALSAGNASAFFLFPHCFHRNYSVIVCRPYNAFTPMCYGSVVCDGCCPSPFCGGGCCQPPIYSGCCDGGCLPNHSAYAAGPAMILPGPSNPVPAQTAPPLPGGPNFTPPPPTPIPAYNQTSLRWNSQAPYGVQPAGYYPGYYPAYPMSYYPVANYPTGPSAPAPYYWYNGQ
jgi:hypothetical protein